MSKDILLIVNLMYLEIMGVIFVILFFIPVIFQIFIGLRSLNGKIKVHFGLISAINIVSQILITVSQLMLISHNLKESGSRDGLGFVMALTMGVVMIFVILFVIIIQLMIYRIKSKK